MKKVIFFLLILVIFICTRELVIASAQKSLIKSCQANMTVLGSAIIKYNEAVGTFPVQIEELEQNGILKEGILDFILTCKPTREISFKRAYKRPQNGNQEAIVSWCPHYHHIGHFFLSFLNEDLRTILKANGSVETVSEDNFKTLNSEKHLQAEKIDRPQMPESVD